MKKHFILFFLALFYSFISLEAGNTVAVVTFVEGEVCKGGCFFGSKVSKGDVFQEGDTITTKDGKADIQIGSGSVVRLNENSELKIKGMNESGKTSLFDLFLSKGQLHSKVGSSKAPNYKIQTNTTTVGVRGTEFVVSESGALLDTGVYMKEGEAEIDMSSTRRCVIKILNFGCNDPDNVILKAGQQIVFDEDDYEITPVSAKASEEMKIINTFKLLDLPRFHSIRQEYYDVGAFNSSDYESARNFSSVKGSSPGSSSPSQSVNPYNRQYNRCCNCCY